MSYNDIIMYNVVKGFYRPGKTCFTCQEYKKYKDFHKNRCKKDGCQALCKSCRKKLDIKVYKNIVEAKLKIRDKQKKALDRKARLNLDDRYIRQLICRRSNIKMEDITEQMIAKRRKQVIIHREKVSKIRKCNTCNISKPFSEYHISKNGMHGIRAMCKKCRNINAKAYRKTMSFEMIERHKKMARQKWNKNGKMTSEQKLKRRESKRKWSEKSQELCRKYRKNYRNSKKGIENAKKAKEKALEVTKELGDNYIKALFTRNTSLSFKDITQEMIDLKRLQVQLYRKTKKY